VIPVRDGIIARHRARMPGARMLPHPTITAYVSGWRWGFVCGTIWGALVLGITWGVMSSTGNPS
jgi:hypothetical protein